MRKRINRFLKKLLRVRSPYEDYPTEEELERYFREGLEEGTKENESRKLQKIIDKRRI